MVAALVGLGARQLEKDALRELSGDGGQPPRQMLAGPQEALSLDPLDAPGAVVLVESGLQAVHHLGVVLSEGTRADQSHLLRAPVADQ